MYVCIYIYIYIYIYIVYMYTYVYRRASEIIHVDVIGGRRGRRRWGQIGQVIPPTPPPLHKKRPELYD